MDGIIAAVPSVMCGVSLISSCRNRVNAESRHHSPGNSPNLVVSLLQTRNCVSSLSIHPSQKRNSLRLYSETSRGIVKSAASSGKKVEPFLLVSRTKKHRFDLETCSILSLLGSFGFRVRGIQ